MENYFLSSVLVLVIHATVASVIAAAVIAFVGTVAYSVRQTKLKTIYRPYSVNSTEEVVPWEVTTYL